MQEKSHESKWSVWVMIALFICLFIYGAVIIYVDPFFIIMHR